MGSVFLADVNDFISPSQACINPIFTTTAETTSTTRASKSNEESSLDITTTTKPSKPSDSIHRRRPLRKHQAILKVQDEDENNQPPPSSATSAFPISDKPMKVSVADCLACNGCITTAETVLVEQHSLTKLEQMTNTPHISNTPNRVVIFTMSRASFVDLARYLLHSEPLSIHSPQEQEYRSLFLKLTSFLQHKYNAHIVLDGNIPLVWSLVESANEFCQRYRYVMNHNYNNINSSNPILFLETQTKEDPVVIQRNPSSDLSTFPSTSTTFDSRIPWSTPSMAISATETRFIISSSQGGMYSSSTAQGTTIRHPPGIDSRFPFSIQQQQEQSTSPTTVNNNHPCTYDPNAILPMLASSCPAFVCYIEKTMPHLVPNLCTVKSPMSIAGTFIKHDDNKNGFFTSLQQDAIYHVAIMPCHDKKLEASRRDFMYPTRQTSEEESSTNNNHPQLLQPDVDLVITTDELLEALNQASIAKEKGEEDGNTRETMKNTITSRTAKIMKYLDQYEMASSITADESTLHGCIPWTTQACNAIVSSSMCISTIQDEIVPSSASMRVNMKRNLWTGSGGYADFLFRYASKRLFQYEISYDQPLPWKRASFIQSTRRRRRAPPTQNNSKQQQQSEEIRVGMRRGNNDETNDHDDSSVFLMDICEVTLYRLSDGTFSFKNLFENDINCQTRSEPVLKFAIAYGFKNIQMVLQKISNEDSRGKASTYHYIEMMACPSGCLNGGGQVRAHSGYSVNYDGGDNNDHLIQLLQKKETPSETRQRVEMNQAILNHMWANEFNGGDQTTHLSSDMLRMLHTRYHVVPKLELTTGATAGVSLDDTKW